VIMRMICSCSYGGKQKRCDDLPEKMKRLYARFIVSARQQFYRVPRQEAILWVLQGRQRNKAGPSGGRRRGGSAPRSDFEPVQGAGQCHTGTVEVDILGFAGQSLLGALPGASSALDIDLVC